MYEKGTTIGAITTHVLTFSYSFAFTPVQENIFSNTQFSRISRFRQRAQAHVGMLRCLRPVYHIAPCLFLAIIVDMYTRKWT